MAPLRDLSNASEYREEVDAVASAVAKRRREFFAGRNLARAALERLGISAMAIARNEDRSPRWPAGVRGSISHTDDDVLVAVTDAPEILGIGVDVERAHSVDEELQTLIRADEREAPLDDTVLFSAKESIFKAVYPVCHEFLEFADVTVLQQESTDGFRAIGRSGLTSSEVIAEGTGRIHRLENKILTAYWIPA